MKAKRGPRLNSYIDPEAPSKRALRQARSQAAREAEKNSQLVKPINRLLDAGRSCGIILLEQTVTDVISAQETALKSGLENTARERAARFRKGDSDVAPILWIPAYGTVQGEPLDDAKAQAIATSISQLRRAHGPAGILGITGLSYDPATNGGSDHIKGCLGEMMFVQGEKSLVNSDEPAVVTIGTGSPDDLATRFGRGYNDASFSGQLATRIAIMHTGEMVTALPPVIPRISREPQPQDRSYDPYELVPGYLHERHL